MLSQNLNNGVLALLNVT